MTNPSLPSTIAIVGLGLMGGSLARDLVARGVRVVGVDRDPGTGRAAAAAGIVMAGGPGDPVLAEAGLLVIALPVTAAARLLPELAAGVSPECVVTDLGSTKRSIACAAEEAGIADRFVGSHPMAGDHRSGWEATRDGLFEGARVYLCPTSAAGAAAVGRVRVVWDAVGARVEEIDPEEHDRRLAWTSHLPQAVSSALAAALDRGGLPVATLGRGGRELTRLAGSSPEMWEAICRDNADQLAPALDAMQREIAELRAAMDRDDPEALRAFFGRGRRWWWEEGG